MIASVRVVLSGSHERTAYVTTVAVPSEAGPSVPSPGGDDPFKTGGDNRRETRAPPRSGRS